MKTATNLKRHLNRLMFPLTCLALVAITSAASPNFAFGQDISVSNDSLKMTAPEGWKKQEPRVNLIEAEYEVPLVDGDDDGKVRVTWMQVGGGIEPNVQRWEGQFSGEDAKSEKMEVGGQTVYMVDLEGTYKDTGGRPFGPATEREDYAMVAAIIEMKAGPEYYIKMVGPANTVKANRDAFAKMIKEMKFE